VLPGVVGRGDTAPAVFGIGSVNLGLAMGATLAATGAVTGVETSAVTGAVTGATTGAVVGAALGVGVLLSGDLTVVSDGECSGDGDESLDRALGVVGVLVLEWNGDVGVLVCSASTRLPVLDRITGTNSLGSYLSLTFSSRLESSSNTDGLASTDLTISDGWISFRSKSRSLCLDLSLSVTLDTASAGWLQNVREPDHFSNISSNALTRSASVGEGGEISESEDDGDGSDGGLGGGEAGGGTAFGLGMCSDRAAVTALGDVTAGGDAMHDLLGAGAGAHADADAVTDDDRDGNCIWAANLGSGSEMGPSLLSLSRGIRRGSLGGRFSGRSSKSGVPGRELSPDSFPLSTVTSLLL